VGAASTVPALRKALLKMSCSPTRHAPRQSSAFLRAQRTYPALVVRARAGPREDAQHSVTAYAQRPSGHRKDDVQAGARVLVSESRRAQEGLGETRGLAQPTS